MTEAGWTILSLRRELASGARTPSSLADLALSHSSSNPSRNTYLWQDAQWTRAEAAHAVRIASGSRGPFGDGRSALWGLPISVKDCFDLAGAPTSCGTRYYRDLHGLASSDSALVQQLRAAGTVIIGKTHLHPLAYGITGENAEFGDCTQPGNSNALTGGSSSGAAASVLEGSAVAAIGTDTGGSIRVPAALCGLAGYRATLGRGDWRGGAHLGESFDTLGWLFRDLEDAPLLAAPFAPTQPPPVHRFSRFAFVDGGFLHDCEPAVADSLRSTIAEFEALGLEARRIDPAWWQDSMDIFAPIQASEAALLHKGHFENFEASIQQRLEWGSRLTDKDLAQLRQRLAEFRTRMDELFATHELLLMPAAPVARLEAGADHSQTRTRLLRYTTPVSLAGTPAVAIPCTAGGMQLSSARGSDESLLHLASQLGALRKSAAPAPSA